MIVITASNITDEQIAALAKCKAASCFAFRGPVLTDEVTRLTYLGTSNYAIRVALADLTLVGFIARAHGVLRLTTTGEALLTSVINARSVK